MVAFSPAASTSDFSRGGLAAVSHCSFFGRVDRNDEVNEKIERLVRLLDVEQAEGVLIASRPNFAWLTAGGSNTVDTTRDVGVASLLVRSDGRAFVLANRIEMQRLLSEEIPAGMFEPIEFGWEEEKASSTFAVSRATSLLKAKSLLSDVPGGDGVRVVEGSIASCRYQLIEPEIDRYRILGRDAAEAITQLMRELEPGLTEKEIAARADTAIAARGARNVVTLVAADDRLGQFRHPLPTANRWQRILMIVVCAQRGGLTVALTRIACAGEMPEELKRRTMATAQVNAQLLAATRPGITGAKLYEIAARAYAAEDFAGEEHLHHQGGAIGYRTRDWVAHPASRETVSVNQAFAWNPSITGTKVEETCLTSDQGIEVLTATADWPRIPVMINGTDYLSPDVLSL
jgi:Xaa-Pro aminopeptidase